MKFREYIEEGEKKAGSQANLARYLDLDSAVIRRCKSSKQGLPDALCIELANLIGADKLEVIAASNLVTEKNPKRIKVYESCLASAALFVFVLNMNIIPEIKEIKNMLHNVNYKNIAQVIESKYTL